MKIRKRIRENPGERKEPYKIPNLTKIQTWNLLNVKQTCYHCPTEEKETETSVMNLINALQQLRKNREVPVTYYKPRKCSTACRGNNEINFTYADQNNVLVTGRTDICVPYATNTHSGSNPIIIWWTPFTGQKGLVKQCGSVKCFFTEDRIFQNHSLTKAFIFYGSNFELVDLPLPRNGLKYDWALLHEESPKNVRALVHTEALELFNLTATFSRHSHFPLTLQYLKNKEVLTDTRYFVPVSKKDQLLSELAPVVYVHSDCSTPLERDEYAKELMKYIRVDSYGKCVQNKELPPHLADPMESMDAAEFLHFVARYKFTLTFENAACQDYITEKLWRPLKVGSVPVYLGSPSVRDWLPNNDSAIIASDFSSPKELADFLHMLNNDQNKYNKYLQHKLAPDEQKITNSRLLKALEDRKWGIDNDFDKGNFIEHFECFICEQEHKKEDLKYLNLSKVNTEHYDCPSPVSPLTGKENKDNWWLDMWHMGKCEALLLKKYLEMQKVNYTHEEFNQEFLQMLYLKKC